MRKKIIAELYIGNTTKPWVRIFIPKYVSNLRIPWVSPNIMSPHKELVFEIRDNPIELKTRVILKFILMEVT